MNNLEHPNNDINNVEPTPGVEAVVGASKAQEASLKKEVNTTVRKSMRWGADVADFNEAGELVIVPQKLVDAIRANPEYTKTLLQNLQNGGSILTPNEITPLAEALQTVGDLSVVGGIVDWIDPDKVDNEELKNWIENPQGQQDKTDEKAESDETLDRLERTKKIAENFDNIYGTDTASTIDESGDVTIRAKDGYDVIWWLEEDGEPHILCGKFGDRNPSISPDDFYFVNGNLYLLSNLSDYVGYDQIKSKEQLGNNGAEILKLPKELFELSRYDESGEFIIMHNALDVEGLIMIRDAFGHTIDDGEFIEPRMSLFYEFFPDDSDGIKYFTDTGGEKVEYDGMSRFQRTRHSWVYKPVPNGKKYTNDDILVVINGNRHAQPSLLPEGSKVVKNPFSSYKHFIYNDGRLNFLRFNSEEEGSAGTRRLEGIHLADDSGKEFAFDYFADSPSIGYHGRTLDGQEIPLEWYRDVIEDEEARIFD